MELDRWDIQGRLGGLISRWIINSWLSKRFGMNGKRKFQELKWQILE